MWAVECRSELPEAFQNDIPALFCLFGAGLGVTRYLIKPVPPNPLQSRRLIS